MDFIIIFGLTFLAGVGLGTFVIGSLIRRIIAETVQSVKAEITKARDITVEAENALKAARKALP